MVPAQTTTLESRKGGPGQLQPLIRLGFFVAPEILPPARITDCFGSPKFAALPDWL